MAKSNHKGNLKRTTGGAFLAGTAMGASLMAAKHKREKSPMQKIMNRLGEFKDNLE